MKQFNPEIHSLADFIRLQGGISTKADFLKGEIRDYFSIAEGYNLINNKSGKSLDYLREAAIESGFLHLNADTRDLLDGLRQDVYSKKVFKKGAVWSLHKQDWNADCPDLETMINTVESYDLSEIYEDLQEEDIYDLSPWEEVEELDLMPVEIFNLYYGGVDHA